MIDIGVLLKTLKIGTGDSNYIHSSMRLNSFISDVRANGGKLVVAGTYSSGSDNLKYDLLSIGQLNHEDPILSCGKLILPTNNYTVVDLRQTETKLFEERGGLTIDFFKYMNNTPKTPKEVIAIRLIFGSDAINVLKEHNLQGILDKYKK